MNDDVMNPIHPWAADPFRAGQRSFPRLQARPGIVPFSVAITVLNLLGHTILGFEQAWLHPLVALATAYLCELGVEAGLRGWAGARFRGGLRNLLIFLLPAHITALAVAMLLSTNERFTVIAFAAALAVLSKSMFRVAVKDAQGKTTHFLNPSNLGITATLVIFHDWVGVAQPYQFTEGLSGSLDWLLPGFIVCTGSLLNWRATRKLPLIGAWLIGFALQALVRALLTEQSLFSLLAPMTGTAFVLFTFYMISDPMTTPSRPLAQVAFGLATAAVYGLLTYAGIVFGLFFSLTLACTGRGALLGLASLRGAQPAPHGLPLAANPMAINPAARRP
ncbi:MAG TPA: hypothetical protein VGM81_26145 [Burkholderiaceae bacterium]